MIVLLLVAGYATRLYPLTENRPKALLPVAGRPMLDHITDQIDGVDGVERIVVVSNHRYADDFREWAASRKGPAPITVLDDGTVQNGKRMGAVGDIQFAIEQAGIDDDLLVIAGDNFFTFDLRDAAAHFRRHGEDMILVHALPPEEDPHRFAIVQVDPDGRVTHMEEKPESPRSDVAAYAVYFYRRDTLPLIRAYLTDGGNPDAPGHYPAWLYERKPVRAYFFDGECIDIGTPEVYEQVCRRFPSVRDT